MEGVPVALKEPGRAGPVPCEAFLFPNWDESSAFARASTAPSCTFSPYASNAFPKRSTVAETPSRSHSVQTMNLPLPVAVVRGRDRCDSTPNTTQFPRMPRAPPGAGAPPEEAAGARCVAARRDACERENNWLPCSFSLRVTDEIRRLLQRKHSAANQHTKGIESAASSVHSRARSHCMWQPVLPRLSRVTDEILNPEMGSRMASPLSAGRNCDGASGFGAGATPNSTTRRGVPAELAPPELLEGWVEKGAAAALRGMEALGRTDDTAAAACGCELETAVAAALPAVVPSAAATDAAKLLDTGVAVNMELKDRGAEGAAAAAAVAGAEAK